jgi:hypothetical protein
MMENDPKKTGLAKAQDPIDALEEFATKQLAETTNPIIREMAEKALAHCADLRKLRELDERTRNAPPEEDAYYALLETLQSYQDKRKSGELPEVIAFYLIARLILRKATKTVEGIKAQFGVAGDLRDLLRKMRDFEEDAYAEVVESAARYESTVEGLERTFECLVAEIFRLHGEPEIADLYENDLAEFDRRYDRGRQIYLAQGGSAEQGKH